MRGNVKATRERGKQRSYEEKHGTLDQKHDFSLPFPLTDFFFSLALSPKMRKTSSFPTPIFSRSRGKEKTLFAQSECGFRMNRSKKTVEIVHSWKRRRFDLKLDAENFRSKIFHIEKRKILAKSEIFRQNFS